MSLVAASRFLTFVISPMCPNKAAEQINKLIYFPAQTLLLTGYCHLLVCQADVIVIFTVVLFKMNIL